MKHAIVHTDITRQHTLAVLSHIQTRLLLRLRCPHGDNEVGEVVAEVAEQHDICYNSQQSHYRLPEECSITIEQAVGS